MTKQPFYEKFIKAKEINIKKQNRIEKEFETNLKEDKHKRAKPINPVKLLSMDNSFFSSFSPSEKEPLNSFDTIIRNTLGLTKKQEAVIPKEIRRLFHELTDERSSRKRNYLNNPIKLSAYIYYYMWWNLVRISKLIKNIDFDLSENDVIADFGAGPLTMACAFWITKPELRKKKLIWYCADISSKALCCGENIFYTLCKHTEQGQRNPAKPWQIIKVSKDFGTPLKKDVNLFVSANMFNEIFWDSSLNIFKEAEQAANTILKYVNKKGKILIIEPGIPLAGEFISYIRKYFLDQNYYIKIPCPHNGICPIPGTKIVFTGFNKKLPTAKKKWCHFSFSTDDAPLKLKELSKHINMEKQKAGLSFLFCIPSKTEHEKKEPDSLAVRITSELIKLDNGMIGKYACSEKGFLLLQEKNSLNAKLKKCSHGALLNMELKKINYNLKDKKTGAFIIYI